MTTHRQRSSTTYTSTENHPRRITLGERKEVEHQLSMLSRREARRNKVFAARFPTRRAEHYVVFTEILVDACTVILWADKKVQLTATLGAPVPDGVELLNPRAITDAEWDMLARLPCYRDTFNDTRSKRGRELAERMLGAHFDGGPEIGDVFLITRELDTEVDLFVRPPGGTLHHALGEECASAA